VTFSPAALRLLPRALFAGLRGAMQSYGVGLRGHGGLGMQVFQDRRGDGRGRG